MRYVRLVVHGRVQGVGYRAWLAGEARRLGVEGWVRNRADGTVEAVLGGEDGVIEALITACREGPASARVREIETHASDAAEAARNPNGRGFGKMPTL